MLLRVGNCKIVNKEQQFIDILLLVIFSSSQLFFIAAKIAANFFVEFNYVFDIYEFIFFYFGTNTLY